MLESIEDIHENASVFNKPICVFMAGKDKIIRNTVSKDLLKKINTPKEDIRIRWYSNAFHNIHKEPEIKNEQLAEIYEFIFSRLENKEKPPVPFNTEAVKNVRVGRTIKKKSIKVKRFIFYNLLVTYLVWGLLILILRTAFRRELKNFVPDSEALIKTNLRTSQVFATIFVWPMYLLRILYFNTMGA